MCEDEGRCLIYTMSRTAAIHCLSPWDIYQTKGHISQTRFPPSPFSFFGFFLTAQYCLEPYLRPPYYDVHKGATDPKTTAEKPSLQQLGPPSGAQNQHSHCRQLLLEAITDSVSLSTVFKNSVNFKSATDVCLQPQDYICKKWILLLLFLMTVAQMRITGLWEIWATLPQTIFPPPIVFVKFWMLLWGSLFKIFLSVHFLTKIWCHPHLILTWVSLFTTTQKGVLFPFLQFQHVKSGTGCKVKDFLQSNSFVCKGKLIQN